MGTCNICGVSAGWFKEYHDDCKTKYQDGLSQLIELSVKTILDPSESSKLAERCKKIAFNNYIPEKKITDAIVVGWGNVLEKYIEDGLLSEEKEEILDSFAKTCGLTPDDLNKNGLLTKAMQAIVIRELVEGRIPQKIKPSMIPFNMQKSETLVWIFNDVMYLEENTSRAYVGASQGVSVRIAKGLYYRTGAFSGHSVEKKSMAHKGTGVLGVTTKNIYFSSEWKSIKVPYIKILTFLPLSDGLGIHTDAKTAKAIAFITGDGWFVNNLVQNLAHM